MGPFGGIDLRKTIFAGTGGLLVFIMFAEWLLWFMPKPHGRLHYMIAGTAATAAALLAVFARVAIRRHFWSSHHRQ